MKNVRSLLLVLLSILVTLTGTTFAASEHIVSRADLQQAVRQRAAEREAQARRVVSFFQSDMARKAFEKSNIDPQEVTAAVNVLDDAELARLADQVDRVQAEVQAGALTNQQITYILIALGTAVIVLILVAD